MRCSMIGLAAAVSACGNGGTGWQTIREQAGDTTLVRTVGVDTSRSAIELREELTIGVLEGEDAYTFGEVTLMAVGADGTIHAYDRQVPVLRAYDARGRHVRTIGSAGAGPGEYRMAQGLAVTPSGRLLLYDPANARVNEYGSDGRSAGEWRFTSAVPPLVMGAFVSGALSVDSAGRVYITTSAGPPAPGASWEFISVRHTAAGVPLDTIQPPDHGYEPPLLVAEGGGRRSFTTPPYTPATVWAVTASGGLASAFSAEYRVTVTDPAGGVLRIEKQQAAVPVSEEERRARQEEIVNRMRRTDPGWRWSGPAFPREKPLIRRLHAAEDGRLWVLLHQPSERVEEPASDPQGQTRVSFAEPTVYDVFDADGSYLGSVRVPPRTTLFVMRGDHAWGVARDSLDVQSIRRYRLEPALSNRSSGPRRE